MSSDVEQDDDRIRFEPGAVKQIDRRQALIRFAAGAGASLVAALVSELAGSRVSGPLLALPAILVASLTLIADEDGLRAAIDDSRGAVLCDRAGGVRDRLLAAAGAPADVARAAAGDPGVAGGQPAALRRAATGPPAASITAATLTQFFQEAPGQTSIGAGLRLMPWSAAPPAVAPPAGMLADRVGRRPILAGGMFLPARGLAWFSPAAGVVSLIGALTALRWREGHRRPLRGSRPSGA